MQATPRQREVLDFIASFTQRNGYPPSVRDIMAAMSIESPNGVLYHVKTLEKKGLLTRKKGLARSLKVVQSTDWIDGVAKEIADRCSKTPVLPLWPKMIADLIRKRAR